MKKESTEVRKTEDFFGILEQISPHGTQQFVICDTLGNKIRCNFPKDKLDEIKSLVGDYVDVSGFAKYKKGEVIPYMVDVQTIEKYKESDSKINPRDLYGSHPDFGKGKTAAEIIREIRDRNN